MPTEPYEVPKRIGPYRVLGKIGRGGMGSVVRGQHIDTDTLVAIKTVHTPSARTIASIRREIRSLARIRHPGIVRIYSEGVDRGLPWYAMELVEGTTLRQFAPRFEHPERPAQDQPSDAADDGDHNDAHAPTAAGSPTSRPRVITASLTLSLDDSNLHTVAGPRSVTRAAFDATHAAGLTAEPPTDDAADTIAAGDLGDDGDGDDDDGPPGWIGGMTSLRAIERGALPPAAGGALYDALKVVRRLCSPLAYLHGEGLVHCDLKPDNVLVRPTGQPVLVDFGVTAHFAGQRGREALDVRRAFTGTAAYMSPEQLRGELLDARADLYSLGCILYELVTGRVPFTGRTAQEVGRAHLRRDPLAPSLRVSGVPEALDDLILRLLAKDPQHRIGYAGDVAAAITNIIAAAHSDIYGADGPPARPYLYRPQLTGRRDVMRALSASLEAVGADQGGLVLIGGESGVGKTRVAVELAQRAEERGARVLTGECTAAAHRALAGDAPAGGEDAGAARAPTPAPDAPSARPTIDDAAVGFRASEPGAGPLHPLRRALVAIADVCRDLRRDRGDDAARAVVDERAAALAVFEPSLAELPWVASARMPEGPTVEAARLQLFQVLGDTLVRLAEARPVVLILDDVQLADELTLGFLSWFADQPSHHRRVLIAATYRAEEAGAELAALVRSSSQQVTRVDLDRLGRRDVSAMIASMLALPATLPSAYVQHIHRHSEGNPFFVAELLRTAVDEGMLFRDIAGRWRVSGTPDSIEEALAALPLPRSLRDVIERRLDTVPAACRPLLDIAAVMGRDVDLGVAAAVAVTDPVAVGDMAQALIRHQVLLEREGDCLGFTHDTLRAIAYARVEPDARRRLHRRIADALAATAGARGDARAPGSSADAAELAPELAVALGYHFGLGGSPRRARACLLAAARMTAARYAHAEAEKLYRTALAYFERADDDGDRDLDAAGDDPGDAGAGDDRRAAIAEAVRGRRELAVDVLHLSGRSRQALRELDRALSDARTAGDVAEEGWCVLGAATVRRTVGPLSEAETLARRALALLREAGDRVGEGRALTALGSTLWEIGDLAAARPIYEQALAVQREAGDDRALGQTLSNLGSVLWDLGEADAGRDMFVEALANLRAHGNRRWEGVTLFNLAWGQLTRGDDEAARQTAEEALVALRESGDRRFEATTLVLLAMLLVERGMPRNARALCEQALALQDEIGDRTARLNTLVALASIERRVWGALDAARALVDDADALDAELGASLDTAYCKVERGHLELAQGRSGAALLAEAQDIATRCGTSATSELTLFIRRLEAAQDAFDRDAPLVRGEAVSALPPRLAQWLVDSEVLAPAADTAGEDRRAPEPENEPEPDGAPEPENEPEPA